MTLQAPHETFAALMFVRRFSLISVLVLVGLGCGPVQSTSYLIDAETMMEAAKTAQADKLAPFEWTSATLYLHKSKEEVGYSDYEQAVDYAKKAVDYATKARDAAIKVGKRAEPASPPEVPGQ